MHRFVWDLHYPPPAGAGRTYPIAAIYRNTPPEPRGPRVLPGSYTVKLTVDGKTHEQPLTVKMDPRVKTPPEGLARQFAIAKGSWEGIAALQTTLKDVREVRVRLKEAKERAGDKSALADALTALDKKVAELEGSGGNPFFRRFGAGAGAKSSLTGLDGELHALLALVDGADASPTTQAIAAFDKANETLHRLLKDWIDLRQGDLKALDEHLRDAKLTPRTNKP